MFTIVLFVLLAIAVLLTAMALSPAFKDKVASSWGVVGTILVALLAWLAAWFGGAPPALPPM